MNFRSGFFIALRYLWARAHEGGRYLRGAAAGIALSLVPIMVTMIVADGMIRGITDRYLELGTGHLQIFDFLDLGGLDDSPVRTANVAGVRGVWQERQGLGVLAGPGGRAGATIRAVDASFWDDEGSGKFLRVIEGEAKPPSSRTILLGEGLAGAIGAKVGDNVPVMTIRSLDDGSTFPRLTPFTVAGIISSGYRELDALWCIMDYEAGQRILSPEFSDDHLIVKIDDPYRNSDAVAEKISDTLGLGYGVYTWKELQRSQYSSYESTRQLLLFIMALIVLVAAVNVSSATSMLAIERQRDIAVLKAAGASPVETSRIFLWGALLTSLCGAILGIGTGLLIGIFINQIIGGLESIINFFSRFFHGGPVKLLDPGFYLQEIPIIINWQMVFFIGLFTVLSSLVSSWIPARRAGKIPPMEILRKY
ncbi:ABC transporter substrate-binding protein [Spirochaetia bacterium]|nr:ABC transporter substrate-binding protein [Spirochaetia bacterium]